QFEAFDPATAACGSSYYTVDVTIDEPATVNITTAGANICQNQVISLSGDFSGSASSATWSEDGNGSLSNISVSGNTVTADYIPVPADAGNTIIFTLTTDNPANTCDQIAETVQFVIDEAPISAITTTATEVCEADPFTLQGTVSGGANNGEWQIKAGQGASVDASGSLTATNNNSGSWEAVFTPNGSYFGDVIFEFVASAPNSCSDHVEEHTLNIRLLPSVTDLSYDLCEDVAGIGTTNVDLTSYNTLVTSENPSNITIEWFSNSSLSNAVSDPTSENVSDNTTYYAKVTLSATNCFDKAEVSFQIDPQVVLTAGSNEEICDGEVLDLANSTTLPSQSNASSLLWTSSGDGEFDDETTLRPKYTPGSNDLANSPITLELTGTSSGACPTVIDQMVLTIKPVAVINPVSDITLCPNDNQASIPFSANLSGGNFSWSATNFSQLGLGSGSGSGNFPAFTAQPNATGATIVSVVTVDYELNNCNSISESFNISIKPTPIIEDISNFSICPGDDVDVIFEANTTGEIFSWTNNNNSIGISLNSTGTGDLSFTANENNTGNPITSIFNYSALLNDCNSVTKTFTITLQPKPVIDPITDIEVCSFESITTNYTSNVSDANFTWTNDNTSTGIPASGSGNIDVNAAENLSGVDEISNIEVTATKNGCISVVESFTVTVKPKPILGSQTDLEICPGDTIPSIIFTDNSSANSTITWTATNASNIGLPASSGTGNIPSFIAKPNNTTSIINSNITVTSNWDGCISTLVSFRIKLKPTPIMNSVSDKVVCGGEVITTSFSNSLGTAGTTYNWSNSNTAIGLPASGSEDLNFSAATNTTGLPIEATISVIASNNGCESPEETFKIIINPTPVISSIANQSFCSEEVISIPFNIDITGASLSITNSNSAIVMSSPVINGNNIEFTTANNTSGSDLTGTFVLTAEKEGCEESESFEVTLKNKPVVSAESDEPALCASDIVSSRTFNHDSGSGTFSWEITNTDLIGDATPPTGSGNFPGFELAENLTGEDITAYVKYFSESNSCRSEEDSFKVTLKPSPVILTSDTVFCAGDLVNIIFDVNTASGGTFFWTNDNTSIGINNASGTTSGPITPNGFTAINNSTTTDNVANITVYGDVNGCIGPVKTIEVRVKPIPIFSADNDFIQESCSGDNFIFTPESNISTTLFEWELISSPTSVSGAVNNGSGEINLTLTNTSSSVQTVKYQITPVNSNCEGVAEELQINVFPEINFENISERYFVCSGQPFTLDISIDQNISGIVYEWQVSSNDAGATSGSGSTVSGTIYNTKTEDFENDTVLYSITPTLNNGLCVGPTELVEVIINQEAIVNAGEDRTVCEGEEITLTAEISGSASIGSWTGGEGTFSNRNSRNTFYQPAESETGSVITFTFTSDDPAGPCSAGSDEVNITIDNLPVALILNNPFPDEVYCIKNEPKELTGFDPSGTFSGDGVYYDSIASKYFFDPVLAGVGGPYNIIHEVINSNDCKNSTSVKVEVSNGPDAEFSFNASPNKFVCPNGNVELSPKTLGGTFSGNGVRFNTSNKPVFDPTANDVEEMNLITYTITDPVANCTSSYTDTIFVLPSPEPLLRADNLCEIANGVVITDLSSYSTEEDSIDNAVFSISANNTTFNSGDTIIFATPGTKNITLTITTSLGCRFSKLIPIEVGNIQEVDFNFENVSTSLEGTQGTRFFDESSVDNNNPITNWYWDFGDPSSGANNTSTDQNPEHNFELSGTYNVTLIIETTLGCSDTLSKALSILPFISNYPYLEDFENDQAGWSTESSDTLTSSWNYLFESEIFKENGKNTSMFWKTIYKGEAGFRRNENSYLNAPNFDLSSLERPMLAFDMWLDVEDQNRAGAIIEYSLNGNDWKVLGGIDDPLNWYNTTTLNAIGDTSSNKDQVAWSYFKNEEWHWKRVAYPLDNLKSLGSNVLFRINFKGNENENSTGMAIDNFYVGERNKNVLLENFTNLNAVDYVQKKENIYSLMNSDFGLDIIKLQFHTSYPLSDTLNSRNKLQLDSRASLYGINTSTRMVLDGAPILEEESILAETTKKTIRERSLQEPVDIIKVKIDTTAENHLVKFEAQFTYDTSKIKNRELAVYFFIIEKRIKNDNSSDSLVNIVRRILPDINGEILIGQNEDKKFIYEWRVKSNYSDNDLAIVSVLQDLNTNEVLQSTITDINSEKSIHQDDILAAISQINLSDIIIYPNPSKDKVYFELPQITLEEMKYLILDNTGKIIKSSTIPRGEKRHEVSLRGVSSGVYHVLFKDSNGSISKKKIVLID
ncbi:T9SS type A sorting domain-containing protein, partial [Marivirga sp. S37H4]